MNLSVVQPVQEAAISWWWVVVAALVAWLWWATRRYATRHPLEPPMQVTDPVCGMTVDVERAFTKVEHSGRTYHFCSESCFTRFVAEPEKYASLRMDGSSRHRH